MFKRYTKNLFENGVEKKEVEEEKVASVPQPPRHPQMDFSKDLPPRIFTGHYDEREIRTVSRTHTEESETVPYVSPDAWYAKDTNVPPEPMDEAITVKGTPQELESPEPETTLGEGVVFKGELAFKTLLRIDGQFEGELVSDGKLVIGPSGVVKSNVRLREAIVEGYLEGNMNVEDRIELRGNAEIRGDITTRFLSVDEGVTIVGLVKVLPSKTEEDLNPTEEDPESTE